MSDRFSVSSNCSNFRLKMSGRYSSGRHSGAEFPISNNFINDDAYDISELREARPRSYVSGYEGQGPPSYTYDFEGQSPPSVGRPPYSPPSRISNHKFVNSDQNIGKEAFGLGGVDYDYRPETSGEKFVAALYNPLDYVGMSLTEGMFRRVYPNGYYVEKDDDKNENHSNSSGGEQRSSADGEINQWDDVGINLVN